MSPLTFVRLGGGLRPAHILGCPKHRQILAAPEIQCLWMDLGVTLPQKQARIIVKWRGSHVLQQCRQIRKHLYIYAYYMCVYILYIIIYEVEAWATRRTSLLKSVHLLLSIEAAVGYSMGPAKMT
jgi:hypothetical protein